MADTTEAPPAAPAAYCVAVGARILELAQWRNLSRMQLASKAGLHVNAVNKMVNGLSDMRLSTLHSLAQALEVETSELLP